MLDTIGSPYFDNMETGLINLGDSDIELSKDERLAILLLCLDLPFPMIRDAVGIGLASLDDHRAIPHLEKQIELEPIKELKEDLLSVVNQLNRKP
jgi:hypothetical protein